MQNEIVLPCVRQPGIIICRCPGGSLDKIINFKKFFEHAALGVELAAVLLLIAADIIKTLVVDLTFTSLGQHGLLVLIRTFLSFALELELNGSLPWQRPTREAEDVDAME